MKTTAQVVAEMLYEEGIRNAFGIPGGEVAEMVEALRQVGIEFVLVKHEAVAAFIADAYGQITGRPGLCVSTAGPGATNLVSGIANAYLDRSPVIAMSATAPRGLQATFTHQVLDLDALFKPITKWNAEITPDNVVDVVSRALKITTSERPGPVHLALPADVARLPAQIDEARPWAPSNALPLASHSSQQLEPVADMVANSQHPVVLVGLTAHRSGVSEEITRLVERLHSPVISSPKAKGTFPEDHPLAVAVVDMAGWKVSMQMLEKADLVIAVGFDPVELCSPWSLPVPLIHIDTVPNEDEIYRSSLEVVGDIKAIMTGLLEIVPDQPGWNAKDIEQWKARIEVAVCPREQGLTPWYALRSLRQILPADGIVTVDVGAHKQLAGQIWEAYRPYTFFNSNGLSSMGYAFPAAIAVKLTMPERDVVCITGDGGFSMVLPDLETAARLGLSLVTLVLNDNCLSLIRIAQRRRGLPVIGVNSLPIDFARVAEGFGAKGLTVRRREAYVPAVREALSSEGPVVVDVHLESRFFDEAEV
ncbi:MAG: thiamine pyrophosphate-binding protein [bacterium]